MPPRPKSLYRSALAGVLLRKSYSMALYCARDGKPWHIQIDADAPAGLAKFDKSSPCHCFQKALQETIHAQ